MPAVASGALTVGPDVSSTPLSGSVGCLGTGNQTTFVNSGPIGTSPISGVVVRFRVRAAPIFANGLAPELRIVQPAGGGLYTGAGSGGQKPFASGIATHDARLPIAAGQLIGVDIPCNSDLGSQQHLQLGTSTGAAVLGFSPELTDGGSPRSATSSLGANTAVIVNADVEPDCDKDGLGDETQDTNTASCLSLTCGGQRLTTVGSEGPDTIVGTPAADVIAALGGNDKLSGLAGNDVICGGAGKDKLKGGKGNDKLYGEAGKDTLKGGPGKDKLKGGAGKDKQVQ